MKNTTTPVYSRRTCACAKVLISIPLWNFHTVQQKMFYAVYKRKAGEIIARKYCALCPNESLTIKSN
jgi:hypothetical protein